MNPQRLASLFFPMKTTPQPPMSTAVPDSNLPLNFYLTKENVGIPDLVAQCAAIAESQQTRLIDLIKDLQTHNYVQHAIAVAIYVYTVIVGVVGLLFAWKWWHQAKEHEAKAAKGEFLSHQRTCASH